MIRKHTDHTLAREPSLAKGPMLLVFSEAWCGPCQAMKPMLEQISGQIPVCEVEPSKSPGLKQAFGISATPTTIYAMDGNKVDEQRGAFRSLAQLRQFARLG